MRRRLRRGWTRGNGWSDEPGPCNRLPDEGQHPDLLLQEPVSSPVGRLRFFVRPRWEGILDFHFTKCPHCGSTKTFWRRGVHFDHERLCRSCGESYDPAEELERSKQQEAERKELVDDRD